jgi:hypothetical protein
VKEPHVELQKGDWVRTETGEMGRVVMIYPVSAFVEVHTEGKSTGVVSYLTSQLTKIDPPQQGDPN